jgi:hypothetical protein
MMRPCRKCGSNEWSFELANAITVRASCKKCPNRVEWVSPKLQRRAAKTYEEFKPIFSREEIESQTGEPPW